MHKNQSKQLKNQPRKLKNTTPNSLSRKISTKRAHHQPSTSSHLQPSSFCFQRKSISTRSTPQFLTSLHSPKFAKFTLNKSLTKFSPRQSHSFFSTTSNGQPLIRTTLQDQNLYDNEANKVFETLTQRIEEPDIDYAFPIELEYSGDVMNFENPRGTWVLNKHNVTKQIWVSSPISGPSKYNYHPPNFNPETDLHKIYQPSEGHGGVWLCERNNTTKLSELLKTEWSEVFKIDIQFQHDF